MTSSKLKMKYMAQTVQAFQFGDEVAIAFPKGFGIKPGQKFKVTKVKDKIILTLIN